MTTGNSSSTPDNKPKPKKNLWSQVYDFLYELFDIKTGLDWVGTVTDVRKKVALKGEQVWMLIAATMIASVGLNLNSAAVIIGAMLISPLMSPILGIGLGVGINDKDLLFRSLKNFIVSTLVVIIFSALYFRFLTPFKDAGNEILSRTQPTILDAIVAIFGGIAGIVAISRKEKGAAIPGVAIATALLPPLAVAGFGLASENWNFFSHAFYLFFLNSTLIALATFIIVRFLKFPYKEHQTPEARQRTVFIMAGFVLALLIPGVLILNQLMTERDTQLRINSFFSERFDVEPYELVFPPKLDARRSNDSISVYDVSYGGKKISDSLVMEYNTELTAITGKITKINPYYFNINQKIEADRQRLNKEINDKERDAIIYKQQINELQGYLDSLENRKAVYAKLSNDVQALFPDLENIKLGDAFSGQANDTTLDQGPIIMIEWNDKVSRSKRQEYQEQMKRYLSRQKGLDRIKIVVTD